MSEFSPSELDAATAHLQLIGCATHDDLSGRALLGYLGHSLKYLMIDHPEDPAIRADAAMYEAFKSLPPPPVDDPQGLAYSRGDTEESIAEPSPDTLVQPLGRAAEEQDDE